MARVDLWAFLHLNQNSMRKAEKEAVGQFQNIGRKAGNTLGKELEEAATPHIRRLSNRLQDATLANSRATRQAKKAQEELAKSSQKVLDIEEGIRDAKKETQRLRKSEIANQRQQIKAQKAHNDAIADFNRLDQRRERMRAANKETKESIRLGNLRIKDLRLEKKYAEARQLDKDLQPLRKRDIAEMKILRAEDAKHAAAKADVARKYKILQDAEESLKRVQKEREDVVKSITKAEQDHAKANEDAAKSLADLRKANEDVDKAVRNREEAIKSLQEAEEEAERRRKKQEQDEKRRRRGRGRGGGLGRGNGGSLIGNMLTDLPFVPSGRGGAAIGSAVLITMASAMEAVVTASQSLATVPAILAAAGAGFATLAIGTAGFSDAVKEMGDPEKFAEALQSLTPAAQQAALEIKYLVDGPLGELKRATQETLFEGVAEQLHNLTNTFQPTLKRLTTGIAGAMNGMFDEFANQLMTPGSQKSISVIIDNIVKAFQNLQPAIAPFTNAMLKLTETGSSFLPGFADAIANAAISFSRFITEAQRSGKLQEFIQKGIDAAKSLGDAIWTIGGRIYEVFGNKSPEDFKKTLDDVIDAAFGLANGLVSASKAVNAVLKEIEPLTNLMKEHPGLVWAIIGAWVGFKGLGLVGIIAAMAGGLGKVATALGKIPTLAKNAGTAITTALAGISIPAWLRFLMKWGGAIGFGGQGDVKNPGDPDYPIDPNDPKYGEDALRRKAREKLGLPPEIPTGGAPGTGNGPHGRDGRRRWNPNAGRSATTGIGPAPETAGLPPWSPFDVPQPPGEETKLSDRDRRDQIWSSLNPNDFMPKIDVPLGPITPGTPRLEYGTDGKPFSKPGYGYTDVDQRAVADAQEKVRRAALDLRDARMEVAILEQDSLATEREIFEAKEKLREEEWEFNQSQLDLVDELNGKWKKVKGGMSDANKLGAGLDDDLGISRGLAGLADNLVRLVGNLATAPLQAMLGKIAAQGDGSSGIIGMLFGKSKDGLEDYDSSGNYVGSSGGGQVSYAPGGGLPQSPMAAPGQSPADFARNTMLPFWQSQGLTVGDHAPDQYGEHGNGALDIMVPDKATGQKVLQQVLSDPNVYGAIFDRTSYGYGRGPEGRPMEDRGSPTQNHEDHVHAWYKPGNPNNINPTGTPVAGFSGPGAFGGSSGATPVFVTNWPFGGGIPGMGGGGSPGGPGQIGKMNAPIANAAAFSGFGNPGSPQAIANMIYQQAVSRGYSPQEAQAIVAYAIGESGLDPTRSGGPQGGPGGANEVVGLFQQKPDFARGGGIDPSLRTNAAANTHAYLNQLEQNRHLPIEQALPATSRGGPLATGADWNSLMGQAGQLLGGAGGPLSTGMPTGLPGGRAPGVAGGAAGGGLPGLFGGLAAAGGGAAGGALGQLAPQRQLPGTGMPGAAGAAAGAVGGLEAGQTAAGQGNNDYKPGEEGWQPQGGGLGVGGLMGAAIQGAMGAGSAMAGPAAPAASAAAQMAMQLIQRTIKYGGEVAAIGVEGLMETFSLGDSALGDMSKSWFGRLLGGLSQAKPALGGTAGKQDEKSAEKKGEQDPNADKQQQQGGLGGVNIGTFVQSPDKNNQQVMNQLNFMSYAAGQPR